MNEESSPACRLWVILARKASTAVIFRRGSTDHVQVLRWDTATDIITEGQWFKGRIEERFADLSPDGELLVYGARKVNGRTLAQGRAGGVGELWTAVSRPPYLTALALWAHPGYEIGGGWFESSRSLVLNSGEYTSRHKLGSLPKQMRLDHNSRKVHEEPERCSGWLSVQGPAPRPLSPAGLWVKCQRGAAGDLTLLRSESFPARIQGGTKTVFSFALCRGEEVVLLGDADWASFLHDGRLALCRDGKLLVSFPATEPVLQFSELADFNSRRFQARRAPTWALKWPM